MTDDVNKIDVPDPGAVNIRELVKLARQVAKTKGLLPKQERFCELRATGHSQLEAYTQAGYEASNVEVARAAASKLNSKPHVKRRIAEMKRELLIAEKGALQAAMQDDPRPPPQFDPDTPELATNDFNAAHYTKEWLAQQAVVNLNQARANGKIDAANGALKFLAELGGHIDKGTPGRKAIAKTPNKGDVGNGEADVSGEGDKQVFNFVIGELDRAARLGDQARDITPDDAPRNTPAALPDQRADQPAFDVDELTRALREGVPSETV